MLEATVKSLEAEKASLSEQSRKLQTRVTTLIERYKVEIPCMTVLTVSECWSGGARTSDERTWGA